MDTLVRPVRSGEVPEHRILREVFRHYTEFRNFVGQGGSSVLEHSYFVPDEGVPPQCPGVQRANKEHEARRNVCIHCGGGVHKVTVSFSFWDLHRGLKELAPRKREALFHNVIEDRKQKDVAQKMGITTVTVGQYVEHAFRQLVDQHLLEIKDA